MKTQIYYTDESSVLLSSYEELVTYNEVKPVISEAVRMTWTYLIQFADKNVPEKQEIELMIISTPQRNVIEDDDIPVIFPIYGQFRLIIKHTARTWGADIESLITHQINSILTPCSNFRKFIRRRSERIGLFTGLLFLISSLIGIYFYTRSFNKNEINKVTNFVKKTKIIDGKVDYLLNYIAQNNQNLFFLKSLLFIVVSIFIAIILGVWVESQADNKTKSYLVLTREANKYRDIQVKKSERKVLWFWASIVISILTGVLSNYFFKWLTGQ
jgi:disulfide bond formation protein DsbB